jgi:precorrin-8X/cobalt-precorrin-8 methylmutase
MDYVKDPREIYRRSFAIIRRESDLAHLPAELEPVAVRLIHTCGITDLVEDLVYSPDVVRAGRDALRAGAPILCDAKMVASGITRSRLPAGNEILCMLDRAEVPELARQLGTTRSAAAVELWRERIAGAVVAVGNAPTALFHLLEKLDAGWPKPAAILAFPVGFVGAAESKELLAQDPRGVPFLALRGRRGGSALAAAAVNAVADPRE